jgi:hypothetical protein
MVRVNDQKTKDNRRYDKKMKHFIVRVRVIFVLILALCIGGISTFARQSLPAEKKVSEDMVSPQYIIVDDYKGVSLVGRQWYYTRIGTDRGEMGDENGVYTANIGGGTASVTVQSGWGGVWTSLKYNAALNAELNPTQLLGPYVKSQYQPTIVGIEVDIIDGSGAFKIELKDKNHNIIAQKVFQLSGGQRTLEFIITPHKNISKLNWIVDGAGHATVDEVRLVIESPEFTLAEAVFLFTYGHLSQCYDADSGLVRDRARWPVEDFAAVQTIGTFSLATAIAWDLGYVEKSTANTIITKTKHTILNLPRHEKGLLPHYLTNGSITENTEWSSVDTVITLIAEILACQAVGEDTSQLETMIKNIDWNDLTGNGTHSIGMGYDYAGNKLEETWDTFGSESFLAAVAYSAATGNNNVKLDKYSTPPTWDGSGFNDELAALFFPMNGTDIWGNNWALYRQEAFHTQFNYFSGHLYETNGLFGLSACEVPEPWTVEEHEVYAAWGVGGHNGQANDGSSLVGYPIIAPHYAAMIAAEHPEAFESVFRYLVETRGIFTPLNNVESFGIGIGTNSSSNLHWNSLKGSWNLSLQALGVSRALSNGNYLAYQALTENFFLNQGFNNIHISTPPQISLNKSVLNFGSTDSQTTSSQEILLSNSGGGTLNWTATPNQTWLQVSPTSGTGDGVITVSVDASGLIAGNHQGTIRFEDPNASNSPQVINVNLFVYSIGSSNVPFGEFSTPFSGSTVNSSIPVTGWVLDDIGVDSVKIYRQNGSALIYIGDALFVEGARPDVEQLYPNHPMNYKAGWGYMMLTNFLPNEGNGTFTIHAIAADKEGHQATLGTKTIICDNAHAVKPFGAIDTPIQGGTASGSNYRNQGWVLTPLPNAIPTDGSTINVYINGVYLGHPTYNIYRSDIASLFPGYANSSGALAYFDFDTTTYSNGVHTIYWTASDNAGNTDGIGSRYFTIQNSYSAGRAAEFNIQRSTFNVKPLRIPVSHSQPVFLKKGYHPHTKPVVEVYPNDKGIITIEIRELERIEVRLFPVGTAGLAPLLFCTGYQLVGSQLRPLPIGTTLDRERGIFYWQPGPGFIGEYQLVFLENRKNREMRKKNIIIKIVPKFEILK